LNRPRRDPENPHLVKHIQLSPFLQLILLMMWVGITVGLCTLLWWKFYENVATLRVDFPGEFIVGANVFLSVFLSFTATTLLMVKCLDMPDPKDGQTISSHDAYWKSPKGLFACYLAPWFNITFAMCCCACILVIEVEFALPLVLPRLSYKGHEVAEIIFEFKDIYI